VREYVWLDDMPLAVVADVDTATPLLWTVHADHLDRPVKMTDGAKAVVWDAVFRPFGDGPPLSRCRYPPSRFFSAASAANGWPPASSAAGAANCAPGLRG
jgi:hypothetical protein